MKIIYIYWTDKLAYYVTKTGCGMFRAKHLDSREDEIKEWANEKMTEYSAKSIIIRHMTKLSNKNHRDKIYMLEHLL